MTINVYSLDRKCKENELGITHLENNITNIENKMNIIENKITNVEKHISNINVLTGNVKADLTDYRKLEDLNYKQIIYKDTSYLDEYQDIQHYCDDPKYIDDTHIKFTRKNGNLGISLTVAKNNGVIGRLPTFTFVINKSEYDDTWTFTQSTDKGDIKFKWTSENILSYEIDSNFETFLTQEQDKKFLYFGVVKLQLEKDYEVKEDKILTKNTAELPKPTETKPSTITKRIRHIIPREEIDNNYDVKFPITDKCYIYYSVKDLTYNGTTSTKTYCHVIGGIVIDGAGICEYSSIDLIGFTDVTLTLRFDGKKTIYVNILANNVKKYFNNIYIEKDINITNDSTNIINDNYNVKPQVYKHQFIADISDTAEYVNVPDFISCIIIAEITTPNHTNKDMYKFIINSIVYDNNGNFIQRDTTNTFKLNMNISVKNKITFDDIRYMGLEYRARIHSFTMEYIDEINIYDKLVTQQDLSKDYKYSDTKLTVTKNDIYYSIPRKRAKITGCYSTLDDINQYYFMIIFDEIKDNETAKIYKNGLWYEWKVNNEFYIYEEINDILRNYLNIINIEAHEIIDDVVSIDKFVYYTDTLGYLKMSCNKEFNEYYKMNVYKCPFDKKNVNGTPYTVTLSGNMDATNVLHHGDAIKINCVDPVLGEINYQFVINKSLSGFKAYFPNSDVYIYIYDGNNNDWYNHSQINTTNFKCRKYRLVRSDNGGGNVPIIVSYIYSSFTENVSLLTDDVILNTETDKILTDKKTFSSLYVKNNFMKKSDLTYNTDTKTISYGSYKILTTESTSTNNRDYSDLSYIVNNKPVKVYLIVDNTSNSFARINKIPEISGKEVIINLEYESYNVTGEWNSKTLNIQMNGGDINNMLTQYCEVSFTDSHGKRYSFHWNDSLNGSLSNYINIKYYINATNFIYMQIRNILAYYVENKTCYTNLATENWVNNNLSFENTIFNDTLKEIRSDFDYDGRPSDGYTFVHNTDKIHGKKTLFKLDCIINNIHKLFSLNFVYNANIYSCMDINDEYKFDINGKNETYEKGVFGVISKKYNIVILVDHFDIYYEGEDINRECKIASRDWVSDNYVNKYSVINNTSEANENNLLSAKYINDNYRSLNNLSYTCIANDKTYFPVTKIDNTTYNVSKQIFNGKNIIFSFDYKSTSATGEWYSAKYETYGSFNNIAFNNTGAGIYKLEWNDDNIRVNYKANYSNTNNYRDLNNLQVYYLEEEKTINTQLATQEWVKAYHAKPSQTITHYAPGISNGLGTPVFMTGKVYKRVETEWIESTSSDTTDCICGVKNEGTWNEFVGIVTSINESTKSLEFATHGDYLFKVNDSTNYKIGDIVLYDGTILTGDEQPTIKINSSIIGKVTSIIDKEFIAVFKS